MIKWRGLLLRYIQWKQLRKFDPIEAAAEFDTIETAVEFLTVETAAEFDTGETAAEFGMTDTIVTEFDSQRELLSLKRRKQLIKGSIR